MNADNSHAERQILRRVIADYDRGRNSPGASEFGFRQLAIAELSRLARIDYVKAAQLLADVLARRASLKENSNGTT